MDGPSSIVNKSATELHMLGRQYMLGQNFGQNQCVFFPNSFSQSGGNILHKGSATSTFGDWRRNPQVGCCRTKIRRKIFESFSWTMNSRHDWTVVVCELSADLEKTLFMEANSEAEYMNLGTLNSRLQILLGRMISNSNAFGQLSEQVTSLLPMSSIMLSRDSLGRFNSNAMTASSRDLNNSTDICEMGINPVGILGRTLAEQSGSAGVRCSQGVSEMLSAPENGQACSPVVAPDSVFSLEGTSRSSSPQDPLPFNAASSNGSVFPQEPLMPRHGTSFQGYFFEQNLGCSPWNSKGYNQLSIKSVKPLDVPSQCPFLELPSNQLQSIPSGPAECTLQLTSKLNAASAQSSCVTHSNGCECLFCSIRGISALSPILSGPISGISKTKSSCHKRRKLQHSFCSSSFSVGTSGVPDSLMAEDCAAGGLPSLKNWPESPVHVEEVKSLELEPMINLSDPQNISEVINIILDPEYKPSLKSAAVPSKSLIVTSSTDSSIVIDTECHDLADSGSAQFEEHTVVSLNDKTQSGIDMGQGKKNSEDVALPEGTINGQNAESGRSTIAGVSLTEFFTREQLEEHIAGLKQPADQVVRVISPLALKDMKSDVTDPISENSCQLCGLDKLLLTPPPIYCSSCNCLIKRNGVYYCMLNETDVQHCVCAQCYGYCRGGTVKCGGFSIAKAKLCKRKNNDGIEESWVECDKCQAWQHQICALFNGKRDLGGQAEYTCPKCCLREMTSAERVPLRKAGILGAADLPRTKLSDHIEQRIGRRLKQEREYRAKDLGKNFHEVPGADDLVVRVVVSAKRKLQVKKQLLDIFHDANYPAELPYCSKKIEGVDVLLFGMYVEEFGSDCGHPNQRCVYISYLDSVKYFRPESVTANREALRTFVYHELLIGYLEHCKERGFVSCFIWACPPSRGQDYLLYCHPESQKTPNPQKLQRWYHSMLRKAIEEKVVVGFSNLYDHYFVPSRGGNYKITAARLPYFEGCYWSSSAENFIENIEQKNEAGSQRKGKKISSRVLKSMGHSNPSDNAKKDILFMQKLGQDIQHLKEDFIVVHLHFVCSHCREVILSAKRWFCNDCRDFQLCERCHDTEEIFSGINTHVVNEKEKHLLAEAAVEALPSDTGDEDANMESDIFESRHAFLQFCQKHHYQFDSLRRAKHSSMMILHYLSSPTDTSVMGTQLC